MSQNTNVLDDSQVMDAISPGDVFSRELIAQELEAFFAGCEFSEILCDGKCATCLQRDWCLLTPVSRHVK